MLLQAHAENAWHQLSSLVLVTAAAYSLLIVVTGNGMRQSTLDTFVNHGAGAATSNFRDDGDDNNVPLLKVQWHAIRVLLNVSWH